MEERNRSHRPCGELDCLRPEHALVAIGELIVCRLIMNIMQSVLSWEVVGTYDLDLGLTC